MQAIYEPLRDPSYRGGTEGVPHVPEPFERSSGEPDEAEQEGESRAFSAGKGTRDSLPGSFEGSLRER